MGRSGGWPLTVFLTPSQKPFFGGTYFPPEDRHGMPGFPKILRALSEAYRERRDEVDGQADELTKAIADVGRGPARGVPGVSGGAAAPYVPGPICSSARHACSSAASTTVTAASAARRSSRTRCRSRCCSVAGSSRATAPRATPRDSSSSRCAPAGSGITSAEGFTVTRPTSGGSCPTSRRCSTTTRFSSARTSTGTVPSRARPSPRPRRRSSPGSIAR